MQSPRSRVGSPKVAQLAAIARRRCLPHDCHFKCAIMAAGLAKKNAILRNSSRGCLLAGRALGFTHSLSLSLSFSPLSISLLLAPREQGPPALRRRSRSFSLLLSSSLVLFLSSSLLHGVRARLRAPRMRIAVGPFTGACGLRVATSPWSTTPSLPSSGSLSCLPPSSLPRSPPPFLFLQTFLPSSLPSLRPRSPHPPLCFSLTRLPLPTPRSLLSVLLFSSFAAALLLLLLLALPTTPVEILVYSTLFLLRLDSENQRVVRTATFLVRARETWTSLIPGASSLEGTAYIKMCPFVINDYVLVLQ